MKRVVLIGGIGSGKSTVCDCFARLGAGVVKLDDIGHGVLTMPSTKVALRDAFGEGVFDDAGDIVRKRLAAAAFDSAEHTRLLDSITHPAIMEECFRRVDALGADHDIVVVEVTSGEMTRAAFSWADAIVAVAAPEHTRVERACSRGFQSEADVRARMARQPDDALRASIADYVIDNGGDIDRTRAAVAKVWRSLVS